MVSLLSSRSGGPDGFAPIPSSGELHCGGQLHSRYSHGVVFNFLCVFLVFCGVKGFTGDRSANPATNVLTTTKKHQVGRGASGKGVLMLLMIATKI